MKTTDALSLLDDAIQKISAAGVQSEGLAALKQYAEQLRKWHEEDERRGLDAEQQAARLEDFRARLANWVEDHKRQHDWNLEMLRSVIQLGQGALRTCLLINGGAAVALLAFAGHIVSSETEVVPLAAVAKAMGAYVFGVLAGGLASAVTYLSQWFFAHDWDKTGFVLNIAAIVIGLGSIALFGIGSYLAYAVFVAL